MTRLDLDPDLERLGEALHASVGADLAREDRAAAALPARPRRARARPRVLAGSTLGLVGIAAALLLALGGSSAPPAFAITRSGDGSVVVKLNYNNAQERTIEQLNAKLTAMGLNEGVTIYMAPGAAPVDGPVTCVPGPGATTPVKVLVGTNGTETIGPGQSAGNTAEGSFHLGRCVVTGNNDNTGNTGAG